MKKNRKGRDRTAKSRLRGHHTEKSRWKKNHTKKGSLRDGLTENETGERLWAEAPVISGAIEKMEDQRTRKIVGWFFAIAVTLVFSSVTAIAMFQSVTMQESSMEPTISVGDRYFMNRIVYKVSSPERGDIIVFKTNASDDAALHIRRVIGLPGETVQIVDGQILIDGETYREGKDFPTISNPGIASSPVTLESGEYFVLGDNRNNSEDSRYGDIGKVNEKYVIGKLWFRIAPLNELGFVSE